MIANVLQSIEKSALFGVKKNRILKYVKLMRNIVKILEGI